MGVIDILSISLELQELLEEHGRYVFLRQSTGQRCHCWKELLRESDPNCASCSTFGWVYVDRKVLAFKYVPTEPTSGSYRRRPTNIGFTSVDECVWYIDPLTQTVNPSVENWVVECKTKSDGTLWPPYKIERCWEVNHVIDLRDNHSQLSYYALRTRRLVFGK